jgi:hypothetical protein
MKGSTHTPDKRRSTQDLSPPASIQPIEKWAHPLTTAFIERTKPRGTQFSEGIRRCHDRSSQGSAIDPDISRETEDIGVAQPGRGTRNARLDRRIVERVPQNESSIPRGFL